MMDLVQISKHSCNIVLPTLGLDPISDKPHGLQLSKPAPNVLAPVFAPPWEEAGSNQQGPYCAYRSDFPLGRPSGLGHSDAWAFCI